METACGVSQYRFALAQDRIDEICGGMDTTLVTSEICAANDYYGQAATFKRFVGMRADRSFKFVIEHGVHLDDVVWALDMEAPVGVILSCSPWRAAVHRQRSNKVAIPVGFGYLYAMEVVRDEVGPDPAEPMRHGTIAFPVHSTHTITANFDHRDYAERLANLPDEFQPVYLCGYWKDILDGRLTAYQERGIPIVSCGHMYDPDFMLRFHDICRQFRYAVSNSIGTHLFQSVASGCRFFLMRSTRIEFDIPEQDRPHCGQFNPLFQAAEARAWQLFATPVRDITAPQRQFVGEYLGTACQRSRAEMRRLIRRSEWIDRAVPRATRMPQGQVVFAPPALARSLASPVRRWMKLKHSVSKRLPGRPKAA